MKIETKYDMFQQVWVMCKDTNKVVCKKVACIDITVLGSIDTPDVIIYYELDFRLPHNPNRDVRKYAENKCFATKQELLDSL